MSRGYVIKLVLYMSILLLAGYSCRTSNMASAISQNLSAEEKKWPEYRKFKSFDSDTTAYLDYTVNKRAGLYKGKTVKLLLKDLEIKPYWFYIDIYRKDISKCRAITLKYLTLFDEQKYKKDARIVIIFDVLLPKSTLLEISKKKDDKGHNWSKKAEKYIEDSIISEVLFVGGAK